MEEQVQRAADAVRAAEALLIGAGAGMGVDSGLPDFRGPQGFWNAYPPYAKLRLNFIDLANPRWFSTDPERAWGFYGQRRNLYRQTTPHAGFGILHAWAQRLRHGAFVFTSNVDGHFQRAGFAPERVVECHGAIDYNQCTRSCGVGIFEAGADNVSVVESTMRAQPPLPLCPRCDALARPNILMFNDWNWDDARTAEQLRRLDAWLAEIDPSRLVVIECGAGTAIPSVRRLCEQLAEGAALIRINVREAEVPAGQIGLASGALESLRAIERKIETKTAT